MPFMCSNLPVASHLPALQVTARVLTVAYKALCELPCPHLLSLISFLLLHPCHPWSFVLSVPSMSSSQTPTSYSLSFKYLLKCYFLKEVFPEYLILNNFLTLTLHLASLFSTNYNLTYFTYVFIRVFYFCLTAYMFHESRDAVLFPLMPCAVTVSTMGSQLIFGEIENKWTSQNALNSIDGLNLDGK